MWLNNAPKGKFFYQLSSQEPQEYRIIQDNVLKNVFERKNVLSFVDINKDGTNDIIVSDPSTKRLNFWLNMQKPRKFGDMCVADDQWYVVKKVVSSTLVFIVS